MLCSFFKLAGISQLQDFDSDLLSFYQLNFHLFPADL